MSPRKLATTPTRKLATQPPDCLRLEEAKIGGLESCTHLVCYCKYYALEVPDRHTHPNSMCSNFCHVLNKQQLSAAAQQTKIRHASPEKIKDCTVWIRMGKDNHNDTSPTTSVQGCSYTNHADDKATESRKLFEEDFRVTQ